MIARALLILALLLTLSACGSCLDPFSKLTDCPKIRIAAAPAVWSEKPLGIYPASAAELNGKPVHLYGVRVSLPVKGNL